MTHHDELDLEPEVFTPGMVRAIQAQPHPADLEPEPEPTAIAVSPTRPTLVPPSPKQAEEGALVERRDTLLAEAAALTVDSEPAYRRSIELAQIITGWIKDAETHFNPDIEAANRLHKSLIAKRKAFTGQLDTALATLKRNATGFYQELQRRREAEQRQHDADARQQEEQARLARKAEADALAEQGKFHEAVQVLAKTMPLPLMPRPTTPLPSVQGAQQRTKWGYTITDKPAFICAVARPIVLRELAGHLLEQGTPEAIVDYIRELANAAPIIPFSTVEEFPSALRMAARAEGSTLNWPGVTFKDEGTLAVRAE